MEKSFTISPIPKADAENYPLLREKGISFLQDFSQNLWTDHNTHDPGVTILELLCYALTDLGYRTSFDFADLITPDGGSGPDFKNQFYRPHEIFSCHPVTITDYRKLILDTFPGIRNVWIKPENESEITEYEPHLYVHAVKHELTLNEEQARLPRSTIEPKALPLKGLYTVKLELSNLKIIKNEYASWLNYNCYTKYFFTDITDVLDNENDLLTRLREIYTRGVLNLLMSYRNLCEDFVNISFSDTEKVTICADIEVSPASNLQQTWFKVYEVILNYISPSIHFYSINDLLAKGKTLEEVFEGYSIPECNFDDGILSPPDGPPSDEINPESLTEKALLKKAFINSDELEKFNKRDSILISDIINLIMDIPGIVTVKSLRISSYDDNGPIVFTPKNDFCLNLKDKDKSFEFILDYFLPVVNRENKIVLYKGLIPYKIPPDGIGDIRSIDYSTGQFDDINNTELIPPSGSYRYLNEYYPVQNDFPPAYLVGKEGISDNAPPLRKSQRLQLKGYLMFYEQILANFLAQLNSIPKLLSWQNKENLLWQNKENLSTYFSQQITNVKDINKLIDYAAVNINEKYQEIFESDNLAVVRKNKFLNHLLARFNENFEELSLLKLSYSADAASSPKLSVNDQKIIIGDKSAFLQDYIKLSRDRSHALNYTTRYNTASDFWDADNISGLQFRAGRKLGIDTIKRRKLLKTTGNCEDPSINVNFNGYNFEKDFGFHVVEHILLRPRMNFGTTVNADEQRDHYLNLCCCSNHTPETAAINFCDDPYSLRLTIVFPGWDNYSPNWQSYEQYIQFRKFVEQMIREEAPAHVALKICWIDPCQMEKFEAAYQDYFQALSLSLSDEMVWNNAFDDTDFYTRLKRFIGIINELKNHYKGGYLHDCNLSEKDKRPFVLNSTVLGSA